MASWSIDSIEISGGYLSDVLVSLPSGLTCVIGPRGSGKSTLAEAIRLLLSGIPVGAPKPRQDLIKANLSGAVLTLRTKPLNDRESFVVRRGYGQSPIITTADARPVTTVDLDRGTFLPIDAYSSLEIEAIADETLGGKRRALLDDLCASDMQKILLKLSDHRRVLEANADSIRAAERKIREVSERIEELGDVTAKLQALPVPDVVETTPVFQSASRQTQFNEKESTYIRTAIQQLTCLGEELDRTVLRAKSVIPHTPSMVESANQALVGRANASVSRVWMTIDEAIESSKVALLLARQELEDISHALQDAHATQHMAYLAIQHENQEAVKAFEARARAEKDAVMVENLMVERDAARDELLRLQQDRKALKADYILGRDEISALRERVAQRLQSEAGPKVRVRVQRNADVLEYQQELLGALYGSKLKYQDDILQSLCTLRPEDLAVIVRDNDLVELDAHTAFGKERGRRVLDALRSNLDPLALEVMAIDDRVNIELNVSTNDVENFKDASELSRGQKCTALLPILLARRDTPLIIDQPEDNLDNHFIYETVVESILRLKAHRQMIFITHNANIPVLGEADLVIVMNSDGRRGFVERAGSLDDCRDEIIDLLEGGEEAFELRRKRYGA